jgi:exosortase/archaeosortase family protein
LIRFLAAVAGWLVAASWLVRIGAVQQHVLGPLARAQGWLASAGSGAASPSVVVTPACSGADPFALLAAAVLAYPAPWLRRVAAALGGLGLLLSLNTLRIASLMRAAGTPAFMPLHLYVWPAVLAGAAATYALGWMWSAGLPPGTGRRAARWIAAAATTVGATCAFAVVSPALGTTAALTAATRVVAGSAAALMSATGLAARADGSQLATGHGWFVVTPECLLTPFIPVYLSAALVLTDTWRARLVGMAACLPFFATLAVARLFTLALPAAVGDSPLFLVHGFHQIVAGLGLVLVLALRKGGVANVPSRQSRLAASSAAILAFAAAAPALTALLELEAAAVASWLPHALCRLTTPHDSQGALLLLPVFQLALFSAGWLAVHGPRMPRRLAAGVSVLQAGHVLLLIALGELAWHASVEAPVATLRAAAVLEPLILLVVLSPRPRAEATAVLQTPVPA